jgi:hypothetical protein
MCLIQGVKDAVQGDLEPHQLLTWARDDDEEGGTDKKRGFNCGVSKTCICPVLSDSKTLVMLCATCEAQAAWYRV